MTAIPQLVIFDCDGVLVDSEPISCGVLAEHLTAAGLPTTLAQARERYQGLQLSEVREHASVQLGEKLDEAWLEDYVADRAIVFREELVPVAHAEATIAAIKARGIAVCVASQGAVRKTQMTLGITGLRPHFEASALFSAEMVQRGKPHPDLFLHAATTMGIPAEHCVVIEDSASGVRAAQAAGMRPIAYTADADLAAIERTGAETVTSLSELLPLLGLT